MFSPIRGLAGFIFFMSLLAGAAAAQSLTVPFDFSRSEIAIDATVKGKPFYVLIDTGVDPSAIDLARAKALHLNIDRSQGGPVSGVGKRKQAEAFPATIEDLKVGSRPFSSIDTLASDMSAISASYGRGVDAFLGFSFLKDKIVLIDYPGHRLSFLDRASDAGPMIRTCRARWRSPMPFLKNENWPLITHFRIGAVTLPATLDTGSSGSITLYQGALDLPGVHAALLKSGKAPSTGFRGNSTLSKYRLNLPAGFGPFRLPPGGPVTLRDVKGSADTSLANVGNKFFVGLKVKMLLNYREHSMTFFGDCH